MTHVSGAEGAAYRSLQFQPLLDTLLDTTHSLLLPRVTHKNEV